MEAEVEIKKLKVCNSCNETEETVDPEPLYECSNCGTQFTRSNSYNENHQCPDCMRFGSKVTDFGCPDCNDEMEEKEAYFFQNEIYTEKEDVIKAIEGWEMEVPASLKS